MSSDRGAQAAPCTCGASQGGGAQGGGGGKDKEYYYYEEGQSQGQGEGLLLQVGGAVVNMVLAGLIFHLAKDYLGRWLNIGGGKQPNSTEQSLGVILGRDLTGIRLSKYELTMADDVVPPGDLQVSFEDIAGMEEKKREIYNLVVMPLLRPDLHAAAGRGSSLVKLPKGALFYGRPGTGKTMLAKAIAAECGATFINLKMSSILDKWLGESNKLVAAVWSLAEKLAPSIIFIDEIDSFLRERSGNDDATHATLKAEFMTHWDGLCSGPAQVMVLAATNRPYDIDPAVLRRLSRHFHVGMPDLGGRNAILELMLKDEDVDDDVDIFQLSELTEGYSGSDLKELCGAAAMVRVHEFYDMHIVKMKAARKLQHEKLKERADAREHTGMRGSAPAPAEQRREDAASEELEEEWTSARDEEEEDEDIGVVRPIRAADFSEALKRVKQTGAAAHEFFHLEQGEKVRC
ncbi:unnamed protein product [Chrysoparadoxa australica]